MKGLLLHKGLNSGKGFGVRLGALLNPLPSLSENGIQWNSIDTIATTGDLVVTSYTLFNAYRSERIFGNGAINQVRLYNKNTTLATEINVYIFRFNGVNYDLVYTENILSKLTNENKIHTVTLAENVTVIEGDFLAVYSTGGQQRHNQITKSGSALLYKAGVPANPLSLDTYLALPSIVSIQTLGLQPMIIGIGDSLMEGHSLHQSMINMNAVASNPSWSWMGKLYATDNRFTYQDLGIGGQGIEGIEDRFNRDVVLKKPPFAAINGGINSLAIGVSKAVFLAKWESILTMCLNANIIPVVWKLMPWSNGSNAQMTARDEWNVDLTTLFNSFNKSKWILIDWDLHLGKFRAGGSEGNLWDLKTEYNYDGIHLTEAGEAKQAEVIRSEIGKKFRL